MKIFISHSSRDSWIAHHVSEDLRKLGAHTFLDAKDIATGDSIDGTVRKHLKESDEILILLSREAAKSWWVQLEMSAAWALDKRLIPILLHVGVNKVPEPFRDSLARDLNDVRSYYDEVKRRVDQGSPAEPPSEPPPGPRGGDPGPGDAPPPRAARYDVTAPNVDLPATSPGRTFDVGDVVRIPDRPQPDVMGPRGPALTWEPPMTVHVGKRATVVAVESDRSVRLSPGEGWWWAMDWLEPVEPPAAGTASGDPSR
jgi:hypothetical protein